ncbi:MAG: radical SAM protein [Candidatus Omnitrophota bacterium]|jgi:MoaA/NifB/PqqE/SkfB family radical SAM enzyme
MFGALFRKPMRFKYSPDAVTEAMAAGLYNLKPDSRPLPLRLFIYPTALCNDRCIYCSDSLNAEQNEGTRHLQYDPRKDFFSDRNNVKKLADDVKRLAVRDIHLFGGGEPFFYKENMFYFLEALRDTDVFIRVITNSNALLEEDVERMVRDRLVSQLNISFNTDSEQTAAGIYSSPKRHSHTLEILSAVTKFKAIYNSPVPSVDIMFTLLKNNCGRIPGVIGNLRGHKVNFFFFQQLRCYTAEQTALAVASVPEDDLRLAGRMLAEMGIDSNIGELPGRQDKGVPEKHPAAGEDKGVSLRNRRGIDIGCYMPLTTLSICYNGNVPICQFRYDRQFSFNYLEPGDFRKFLHGKEYRSFLRGFIGGKELPEVCRGCLFCVNHEVRGLRARFRNFDSLKRKP